MCKIGYLVPEFPGQTHAFFWRELKVLAEMGIEADLISTRRPPNAAPHAWAESAHQRTGYLFPPSLRHFPETVEILRAGFRLGSSRQESHLRQLRRAILGAAAADGFGAYSQRLLRQVGLLAAAVELVKRSRRLGWNHVHVHSCGDSAQVALYSRILGGITYSLTLHGPLGDYGRNQGDRWREAAFALVITRALLRQVERSLSGNLPQRLAVAPMGVDTDKFMRASGYKPYVGEGPLRLMSCGRLNPSKGHDVLVSAVCELRRRGHNVELVIAGEDEEGGNGYRRVLQRQIDDRGLSSVIRLLGAIGEDRVREELESAHVFALASHAEPLGVAIMEAMSLEMPVVVTESEGVAELVTPAVNGILVPPADSEALANAIAEVASQPLWASTLGTAARGQIVSCFSSRGSAKALADMVRAL